MSWVLTAVGVVVVGLALRDVFHTVLHPSGRGSISRVVMAMVWRLLRPRGLGSALSGPLAVTAVIATWGMLIVVGWALVYWAWLPDGFSYAPSLRPGQRSDLLDAFYLSLVAVATLGLGDILPTNGVLRIAVPGQAMVGFLLFTAGVSWVLQVYPALMRRRVLSLRLTALRDVLSHDSPLEPADVPASTLDELATAVVQAGVDLDQYAVTYYFRDVPADSALPVAIGYAAELADVAQQSPSAQTRLSGRLLRHGIDDLAAVLDQQFLHTGADTDTIMDAYARDQGHADARERA